MKINGINFIDDSCLHRVDETLSRIELLALNLDSYHGRAVVMESERSLETALRFLALLSKKCDVLMLPSHEFHNAEYSKFVSEVLGPVFRWPLSEDRPFASGEGKVHSLLTGNHFIVKTSGTSGMKNKFVLHDPELFFRKFLSEKPSFERTLNFFPPDSIAGVETLIEAMIHGTVMVNPGKTPDPGVISELIVGEKVDYLHVTPTFLNLLLISGHMNGKTLEKVRTIAFGSEPAQSLVLDQVKKIAPHVSLKQVYGMSEIGLQKTLVKGDPSWIHFDPSVNPFRVENGELIVKSLTPMISYLNHDKKIAGEWFHTGDMVFEKNGDVRVIGRSDDVINVAGKKFHPIELEEMLMELEGVQDVMVTSEPHDLIGNIVIAHFTCPAPGDDFRARLKDYLEKNVPAWMRPQKVVFTTESEMSPRLKKRRKTSV